MAELTVSIENENFIQVPVQLDQLVEQLKRVIEFETTILIKDQVLTFDGKILENEKKLSDYVIKHGDLVLMTKNVFSRPPPQQQPQRQPQQQQPQQGFAFNQPQPQKDPFTSPQDLIDHFSNNPEDLSHIISANPPLANAILEKDMRTLSQFVEQVKQQRRVQELAIKDPYGEEYQKALYEQIQKQNIEQNMQHAMEHTPEVFASVYMLYIECSINGYPLKAFVDTGAQQSIMSERCAEKCGLARIIDKRFQGIAKGVGTSKIIGRVHNTDLKLGKSLFSVSLSILQNQDVDFILGLDMLKRHQVILNLGSGKLLIASEEIEFLHEKDLKEILNKEEKDDEEMEEDTKKATENSIKQPAASTTTTTTTSPTTANTTTNVTSPSNNNNNTASVNNNVRSPTIAIAPQPQQSSPPQVQPQPTQPIVNSPQVQPSTQVTSPYATEQNISTLASLGCPRDRAIRFLIQAKGNVEVAASIFFG